MLVGRDLDTRGLVHGSLRSGPLFFLPSLIWVLLGFATVLLPSPNAALLCLMVLSLAWAASTVLSSGGHYLLPSSVMYLASSVFVGFACYYLVILGSTTEPEPLRMTAMLVFVSTVFIEVVRSALCLRWRVEWPELNAARRRMFVHQPPRHFALKGMLLLAVSRMPQLLALNSELANAVGLVGVLVLVLNGLAMRNRVRWGGDLLIVLASLLLPVFWTSLVFTGGGRLTVAGLGVAVAFTWNTVRPSRLFKVLVLLAVPVAMLIGGIDRSQLIEEKYGITDGTVLAKEGMYSVYDPLDRLSTVVQNPDYPSGDKIGPRYGGTFVNALLMPIPRSMWEGKPLGFGAEITALMAPSMVRHGQSYSTLAFGEWYANFGWAGFVALPIVFGYIVAWVDRRYCDLVHEEHVNPDTWWRMVLLGCLVASMGDLYWGGSFTFATRGGMAAVVALAVWKFSTRRTKTVVEPPAPRFAFDARRRTDVRSEGLALGARPSGVAGSSR